VGNEEQGEEDGELDQCGRHEICVVLILSGVFVRYGTEHGRDCVNMG
jgi:hypothetical protein